MVNRTRVALAVILFFQFAFGVLYAVRTPLWQAPDEPAHFNYVRALAETGTFPILQPGDYDQAYLEKIKAEKFPPELAIDSIRYEAHQPPLFYVIAAPLYLVARALNSDPAILLRFMNVALALVLSLLAFRIYRLVFPDNALLCLAGVGIIATLPMHLAMSAAINNDTLAEIVVAVLLLFSILRVQGKLDARKFLWLGGAAYGIALLTKTTIYSSAFVLILAEVAYRQIASARGGANARELVGMIPRRDTLGAAAKTLAPLFGIALLLALPWFVRNAFVYGANDLFGWARHDAVVAGQPTTAQWVAQYGLRSVLFDFFAISFKSFWAQFGWMGVLVNDRLYVLFLVLTATASLGALVWVTRLVREHKNFTAEIRATWLLLGIVLALAAAAHGYYNLKFVQPQGRYLFPALIPLAAFWAVGLYELMNARYAGWIFGLLYVLMLGVDYVCLTWFIVPQLAR